MFDALRTARGMALRLLSTRVVYGAVENDAPA